MKKTVIVLALAALLIAPSCAKPEQTETQNAPTQNEAAAPEQATAAEESAQPYTFAGTYMEENADPESTYMRADISGNVIEINWIMDSGKTVALYWAGTFQQPTGADDYTFDSANDTEKTGSAILASSDPTKSMTVSGQSVSFSVTAMGLTRTVRLIPSEG